MSIQGEAFPHLIYHFVLTYSNWEAATICSSESFESLLSGLQNAVWELGAVPHEHRTDSLSAAVNNLSCKEEFTDRYEALLRHYGLRASHTQAGKAHENGDIEQSHHRFKRAIEQELLLRSEPRLWLSGGVRGLSAADSSASQCRAGSPAAGGVAPDAPTTSAPSGGLYERAGESLLQLDHPGCARTPIRSTAV